ncbi:MAG: ribbon-helix-helix protein, CopG family [Prochloraceae cyanobacterium]|nr:ribbon-helix-helix protein, CopG family [Prochloraceae cyanobacterium]
MPRQRRVNVRLSDEEFKFLQQLAKRYGASKSDVMRMLLRSEYELQIGHSSNKLD